MNGQLNNRVLHEVDNVEKTMEEAHLRSFVRGELPNISANAERFIARLDELKDFLTECSENGLDVSPLSDEVWAARQSVRTAINRLERI